MEREKARTRTSSFELGCVLVAVVVLSPLCAVERLVNSPTLVGVRTQLQLLMMSPGEYRENKPKRRSLAEFGRERRRKRAE